MYLRQCKSVRRFIRGQCTGTVFSKKKERAFLHLKAVGYASAHTMMQKVE
jgi:hypothetical protein